MLQLARRARLLTTVPRLQTFLPVPASTSTPALRRAISSTTGSNSSSLLTTESLHTQYARLNTSKLKEQLASRNLSTFGRRLQLVERLASDEISHVRKLSTSSRQYNPPGTTATARKRSTDDVMPEIPKPGEIETTGQSEPQTRVPITPDNKLARYHRYEVVPEVASPTEHVVSTAALDAEGIVEPVVGLLAHILEDISVVEEADQTEKYTQTHKGMKDAARDAVQNAASKASPDHDSLLYMFVRFPGEVVKDMMADILPAAPPQAKHEPEQGSTGQQTGAKGDGPQEFTASQRTALYTIGGLSAGWYFFGF